jgi:hypothetical protein
MTNFVESGGLDALLTAESQMFLTMSNISTGQQDILLDPLFQLTVNPGGSFQL